MAYDGSTLEGIAEELLGPPEAPFTSRAAVPSPAVPQPRGIDPLSFEDIAEPPTTSLAASSATASFATPKLTVADADALAEEYLGPPSVQSPVQSSQSSAQPAKQRQQQLGGGGLLRRTALTDPEQQALDFFTGLGWSREQAAGIVGNLSHESEGMQHDITEKGGTKSGYGLAQWTSPNRQRGLFQYARSKGESTPSFQTQLEYVHMELTGPESEAGNALQRARTVQDATRIFSDLYERPGIPHMESRLQRAARAYSGSPIQPFGASEGPPVSQEGRRRAFGLIGARTPEDQAAFDYQSMLDQIGDEYLGDVQQEISDGGVMSSLKKQAVRAVPTFARTLDATIQAIGEYTEQAGQSMGVGPLASAGQAMGAYGREGVEWLDTNILQNPDYMLPKSKQIPLWGNWRLLADPEWLAYNTGEAATSMLPVVAAYLSGGASLAAFAGGSMEASNTYTELRKAKIDPNTALTWSMVYGTISGALNALGAEKMLNAVSSPGFKANLARRIISGTWEAGTEWAEEPFEAASQALAKGKDWNGVMTDTVQSLQNVDVIPGSFLLGAAGSGAAAKKDQGGGPPPPPTPDTEVMPGQDMGTYPQLPRVDRLGIEAPQERLGLPAPPTEGGGGRPGGGAPLGLPPGQGFDLGYPGEAAPAGVPQLPAPDPMRWKLAVPDLTKMSKDQMVALADERGIPLPRKQTKLSVFQAIKNYYSKINADEVVVGEAETRTPFIPSAGVREERYSPEAILARPEVPTPGGPAVRTTPTPRTAARQPLAMPQEQQAREQRPPQQPIPTPPPTQEEGAPNDAQGIRNDAGQVYQAGDAGGQGEGARGPNLERPTPGGSGRAGIVGEAQEATPEEINEAEAVQIALDSIKTPLDAAAHEAASSPLNERTEPTTAQIEADNAKLGHFSFSGIPISIENPIGSIRKDKNNDPPKWQTVMKQAHYGRVKGVRGKDGDLLDVFVRTDNTPEGADNETGKVFIIDQVDPETGKFDELKVVLGSTDEQQARETYLANYEEGWRGLGAITEFSLREFKTWLKGGDATKPVGKKAPKEIATEQGVVRQKEDVDLPFAAGLAEQLAERKRLNQERKDREKKEKEQSEKEKDQAGQKEHIVSAVVSVSGNLYEAPTHAQAAEFAEKAGDLLRTEDGEYTDKDGSDLWGTGWSDLFKTSRGRIVDRFTASREFDVSAGENIDKQFQKGRETAAPSVTPKQTRTGPTAETAARKPLKEKAGPAAVVEKEEEPAPAPASEPITPPSTPTPSPPTLTVSDLDTKSIIVKGDYAANKDRLAPVLKKHSGLYNGKHKGWVFPKKNESAVRDALGIGVKKKTEPATQPGPPRIIVGKNRDGNIRVNEAVAIRPTRAGVVSSVNHTDPEFMTVDEVEAGKASVQSEPAVQAPVAPTKSMADASREDVMAELRKQMKERGEKKTAETSTAATTLESLYLNAVKVSADTPQELRPQDVDRVMSEFYDRHPEKLRDFKTWLYEHEGMTNPRTLKNIKEWASEEVPVSTPTPTDKLESAAGHMKAIADGIKKINALFGEEGSFSTAPISPSKLDETKWRQVRPILDEMWGHAVATGRDVKDFVSLVLDSLSLKAAPYFERFIDEKFSGNETPNQTESPTLDESEASASSSQRLATWVKGKVARKESFTWQELFSEADKAFSGTQAQGKYTPKDAYDAMEMGVNQAILASYLTMNPSDHTIQEAEQKVKELQDLIAKLPTQSKRTEEMDEFQQFSTPPPLAYLASWVANTQEGTRPEHRSAKQLRGEPVFEQDVVLEPSAGIGGLAVFAKNAGAKVFVNELSPRRTALLEEMGFDRVFTENAEQLDNVLPGDVKPTVVIMNPPFSSTAGRIKGQRDTKNAARHIEQALNRLEEGGRLVAIVGRGMSVDAPSFRDWFAKIGKKYTVKADIGISGKGYQKYGTTFDNRVIVIDKTGPGFDNIIKGSVENVADALPLLVGVRNERQRSTKSQVTEPAQAQPSRAQGAQEGQTEPGPGTPAQPATDVVGTGQQAPRPRQPGKRDNQVNEPVEPGRGDEGPDRGERGGRPSGLAQESEQVSGEPGAGTGEPSRRADDSDREGGPGLEVSMAEAGESAEALSDSVYDAYKPSVRVTGSRPHPGNIVESAAMASVVAPSVDYTPSIPKKIIEAGKVSDVQLESIVRVGQAHSTILDNNERQGAMIGDGTGLGKGREIAGIFLDNWNKGRKKGVWLSANSSLFKDARRDTEGIGDDPEKIFDLGKVKATSSIGVKDGILFGTYDTLKMSAKGEQGKEGKRRIDQVVEWLGEDFDGVIAMDECVPAGTLISTPNGEIPIELIKIGDEVYGFDHDTQRVIITRVHHLFCRETTEPLLPVVGTFTTPNHPIFTLNRGYVQNYDLCISDIVCYIEATTHSHHKESPYVYAHLQEMQNEVPRQKKEGILLREELCGKISCKAYRLSRADLYARKDAGFIGTGQAKNEGESRETFVPGKSQEISLFGEESVSRSKDSREGSACFEGKELSNIERWQRQRPDIASENTCIQVGMVHGSHCPDGEKNPGLSDTLQDRYWECNTESCDRDRWLLPFNEEGAGTRREENGVLTIHGMESNEIYERRCFDGNGQNHDRNKGACVVHNIETGTANYFANKLLVHNCHRAGNALQVQGQRGRKDPSKTALAVIELQDKLPNARVVYVSATGATEVMNLAYAKRLGLWGEGTPFPNVQQFVNQIQSGGIAAMELVSRDMKSMGKYLARSLSFHDVTYDRLEHVLSDEQREIYDKLAEGWQVTLNNLNEALQETGVTDDSGKTLDGKAKSAAMSAFWGAHQRFFNQIITSLQMPSVIARMHKEIEDGNACVIQLVNTNEASLGRAMANLTEDDSLEDLDLTPRDQLMQYIQRSFPVYQYEQYEDADGNVRSRPVMDSNGNPVINRAAEAKRERLLDQLGSIRVPDGPLEMILNEFGVKDVAEITGRTQRVVTDENGQRVREKRSKAKTETDAQSFQEGKKRILVFSTAGGTGLSYHADINAKNQKKRIHFLVQAGWRADVAVQGFGRTHRTNQKQAPHYLLVTTDLKGQKRFLSSIARRLDQLGALTKGQRQTGSQGFFSARDNLESDYATEALQKFLRNLLYDGEIAGVSVDDFELQTGLKLRNENGTQSAATIPMTQFLNRILSLKYDTQNAVFDAFSAEMDAIVKREIEAGTLDRGLENLKADKIELVSEQVVHTDEKSGAETKYVELDVSNPTPVVSWKESGKVAKNGYYQNLRSKNIWAIGSSRLRTKSDGDVVTEFTLTSPASKKQNLLYGDLYDDKKWVRLEKEEAEKLWSEEYDKVPKMVTQRNHLISGAILPIWDRLSGKARIVRIQTDKGQRFLGRLINREDLAATLRNLGATRTKAEYPTDKAIQLLGQGHRLELSNGWIIKESRVSGERRIEILGPNYAFDAELDRMGVFTERVNWKTRYFIPTGTDAGQVLDKVTKSRPIVDDMAPFQGSGVASDEEPEPTTNLYSGFPVDELIREIRAAKAGIESLLPGQISDLMPRLTDLGVRIIARGHNTARTFKEELSRVLGDAFDAVRRYVLKIFAAAQKAYAKLPYAVKNEWGTFAGPKAKWWDKAEGKFSSLYDKKARFEIDDSGAKLLLNDISDRTVGMTQAEEKEVYDKLTLKDVLYHPELYRNYPSAADIKVKLVNGADGSYNAKNNIIEVAYRSNPKKQLLHEIQHALQTKEGFAKGGSPGLVRVEDVFKDDPKLALIQKKMDDLSFYEGAEWDSPEMLKLRQEEDEYIKQSLMERFGKDYGMEIYNRLAGEIEARDVSARANLTPEQRRATPPYSSENIAPEDAIVRFGGGETMASVVNDAEAKRLEAGKKIKLYRAMQLIDGKLYPPMSAKVGGKLRRPTEIGQWERAEENPELATDDGKFKLYKGNKKYVTARYNPYFHTSKSPLNDQFSEAYQRPNLVTVEVEIPESELTSGYKAEKAKDAVGEVNWPPGPVTKQLLSGKRRTIILSRYAKVVRIVPDSEVADIIVGMLKGENVSIPEKVVTPSLKAELVRRGVPVGDTPLRSPLANEAGFIRLPNWAKAKTRTSTGDAEIDAVLDKIGPAAKTIKEKLDAALDNWKIKTEQGIFDRFASLKALSKSAGITDIQEDPYVATTMTTSLGDMLATMMNHGAPQWKEGAVWTPTKNKGLAQVFEPVADQLDLFLGWMVGKRAEKLMGEGRENYFTGPEIQALKRIITLPGNRAKFLKVEADYIAFKKKVLDFAESSGVINAEERLTWDHDEYVPFYRIMEETQGLKGPRNKNAVASQYSGIKKLKGGESRLGDIFVNIMMNFSHLVDASVKNHATELSINAAERMGIATKAKNQFKPAFIPGNEIKKVVEAEYGPLLESMGIDTSLLDFKSLQSLYRMFQMTKPQGPDVIHVLRDGKPVYYHIHDPLVLRSLSAVNERPWGGPVLSAMRTAKRLLTRGVTADPGFMIANLARDTVSAWVVSPDFKVGVDSVKGVIKTFQEDEDYIAMQAAGGAFSGGYAFGHDLESAKREVEKLNKKYKVDGSTVLDSAKKMWAFWEKFGSRFENATRTQIYTNIRERGGTHLEGAYEAKRIMDYSKRGDWMTIKFLCETVPFFGARLQGAQRLYHGYRENPRGFATKGAILMGATLALYAINSDDDRYKELEEWDKDNYYHFFIFGEHFRLPKPFEVGAIFSTIPERLAEWWLGEGTGKLFAERMLFAMTQTFSWQPPQLIGPVIEQYANKSFFTGRPIEGQSLQSLQPGARRDPWTGETVSVIGEATNISPKRMEAMMRGYFGTLGTYALMASDVAMRWMYDYPEPPSMRLDDMPVIRRFIQEEPARHTKYVTSMYAMIREVDQLYATVRRYQKTMEPGKASELIMEERQKLAYQKTFNKVQKNFNEIDQAIRNIHLRRDLTPEMKRKRIDDLTKRKNQLARQVYDQAKKAFE